MKNKLRLLVLGLVLSTTFVFAQKKCEVLKKDIAGKYVGDCKKGLAHGIGKSTGENIYEGKFKKGLPNGNGAILYSDGGKYVGNWKNGFRSGEGKYVITINGKESIKEGIWKKGKYVGKKAIKQYKVSKKIAVSGYRIKKMGEDVNRVTIKVRYKGQALKNTLENVVVNSGRRENYSGYIVFKDINVYPFNCNMRYNVPSAMGSTSVDVEFSFKILEKGDWMVELNH